MQLLKERKVVLLIMSLPILMGDKCPEKIDCTAEYAQCETTCADHGGIGTFSCDEGSTLDDGTEMLPFSICTCAWDIEWDFGYSDPY